MRDTAEDWKIRMTKQFRIVLPLEVWGEFDDDENHEYIKDMLGEQLDMLLVSTDYLWDYWKNAQVEEVEE